MGVSRSAPPEVWTQTISSCITEPSAKVGTWSPTSWTGEGSGYPFNGGGLTNTGTQNDYVEYAVTCSGGTYTIAVFQRKSSNVGITTVTLDGVSLGTVDGYAVSPAYLKTSYTGVAITPGKHLVRLAQSTKNASSSGYLGNFFGVALVRTA